MTLKLCPLIEYKIKKIFMEKSYRICATKANPKPLFYFGIIQNNHCMQETFLEIRYYGTVHQKALIKLTLFFLANSVPFSGQSYRNSARKTIFPKCWNIMES